MTITTTTLAFTVITTRACTLTHARLRPIHTLTHSRTHTLPLAHRPGASGGGGAAASDDEAEEDMAWEIGAEENEETDGTHRDIPGFYYDTVKQK